MLLLQLGCKLFDVVTVHPELQVAHGVTAKLECLVLGSAGRLKDSQ